MVRRPGQGNPKRSGVGHCTVSAAHPPDGRQAVGVAPHALVAPVDAEYKLDGCIREVLAQPVGAWLAEGGRRVGGDIDAEAAACGDVDAGVKGGQGAACREGWWGVNRGVARLAIAACPPQGRRQ